MIVFVLTHADCQWSDIIKGFEGRYIMFPVQAFDKTNCSCSSPDICFMFIGNGQMLMFSSQFLFLQDRTWICTKEQQLHISYVKLDHWIECINRVRMLFQKDANVLESLNTFSICLMLHIQFPLISKKCEFLYSFASFYWSEQKWTTLEY